MFRSPKNTPWGKVDWYERLCPGVFMVAAEFHGGTMVSKAMAAVLSPAARKYGLRAYGFLCFDEINEENIVLRELLDKKMWDVPDRIKDKEAFEKQLNDSLRKDTPEYWRARQSGLETVQPQRAVPVRSHSAELS